MSHWWRGANPLHPYLMTRGLGRRANKLNPLLVNAMTAPWRGAATLHPCLIYGMDLRGRTLPRVPTRTAVSRRWVTGRENLTTRLITGPHGLTGRGGRGFLVLLSNTSFHGCLPILLLSIPHTRRPVSTEVTSGQPSTSRSTPIHAGLTFLMIIVKSAKMGAPRESQMLLTQLPAWFRHFHKTNPSFTYTVKTTNLRAQAWQAHVPKSKNGRLEGRQRIRINTIPQNIHKWVSPQHVVASEAGGETDPYVARRVQEWGSECVTGTT